MRRRTPVSSGLRDAAFACCLTLVLSVGVVGVLLLNTSLTVRSGAASSHQGKGWETFTDEVLSVVNDKPHRVVFILWGAHARKKKALIDLSRHTVIESAHPSPLSAHNGFFGSKPFSRTNAALVEAGLDPIDWRLPSTP